MAASAKIINRATQRHGENNRASKMKAAYQLKRNGGVKRWRGAAAAAAAAKWRKWQRGIMVSESGISAAQAYGSKS
jgi:hypothetical protein